MPHAPASRHVPDRPGQHLGAARAQVVYVSAAKVACTTPEVDGGRPRRRGPRRDQQRRQRHAEPADDHPPGPGPPSARHARCRPDAGRGGRRDQPRRRLVRVRRAARPVEPAVVGVAVEVPGPGQPLRPQLRRRRLLPAGAHSGRSDVVEDFARFVELQPWVTDPRMQTDLHFRPQVRALQPEQIPYSRIYDLRDFTSMTADLHAHLEVSAGTRSSTSRAPTRPRCR